jgi:hypothetical protein
MLNRLMPEILLTDQWRFWQKVAIREADDCWIWTGARSNKYGSFRIAREMYRAHRVSYWIHYREDDPNLDCLHECNIKLCVNPGHLYLGTVSENIRHAFQDRLAIAVGPAQLNDDLVREIRNSSLTTMELAKKFGRGWSTIDQARRGDTWQHVR